MLHDAVEVLKVFPNEPSDAWVCWNSFFFAIILNISCCRAANRDVIDVWLCYVRYFWSEYVRDVVMEDGD